MNLVQLTRHLVDIPSITGEEFAVGTFLQQYLTSLGYQVSQQEIAPNRFNVVASTISSPPIFPMTKAPSSGRSPIKLSHKRKAT